MVQMEDVCAMFCVITLPSGCFFCQRLVVFPFHFYLLYSFTTIKKKQKKKHKGWLFNPAVKMSNELKSPTFVSPFVADIKK